MPVWPFGAKRSARREEIRRSRAERLGGWYRRFGGFDTVGWVAVITPLAIVFAVVVNLGPEPLPYRQGLSVARAITARVDFQLEDQTQTRDARTRAHSTSPNYYVLDVTAVDDVRGRLLAAMTAARAAGGEREALRTRAAAEKVQLDDGALDELLRLAGEDAASEYEQVVESIARNLRNRPIVSPDKDSNPGIQRAASTAFLLDPDAPQERSVPTGRLVFTNDIETVTRIFDEVTASAPAALRESLRRSLAAILRVEPAPGEGGARGEQRFRPLYRFSQRTLEEADRAAAQVPTQYISYKAGDVIADAGVITADEFRLLQKEQEQVSAPQRAGSAVLAGEWAAHALSRGLLAVLIVAGVATYVSRVTHRAVRRRGLLRIALLLIGVVLAARLTAVAAPSVPPGVMVGYVALGAALLTLMRPPATVFTVCTGLAVMTVLATRGGIGFLMVLLVGSAVFAFGLREVRNRGRIVFVGLLAGLATFATNYAVLTIAGQAPAFAVIESVWAGGAAVAAAFVVEGLLPWFEWLFGFSTGMTLLEWCDANKPLQRMMAAEAPGTYNHSMLVGTLSEAACEAIAADGLLARTGAYYHDIGKVTKPEYFVENQTPGVSRHDRLSPAMSHLIIVGHVKDGIEMAREYGLPESLHAFIAEHHGTTLVEYFYHAAAKQRKADDPAVSDSQFRYPGPKPQSRETAILMLADGVEGAVRAMTEPTPNRIETVVSELVRKRLMDRQLDECDLTFRELAIIEATLIKSLCSIYHARIRYPGSSEARADTKAS